MVITYRIPTPDDMKNVSEQIKRNYVAAYERLMDHDYLSTLKADHWEPILQESIQNGDPCLNCRMRWKHYREYRVWNCSSRRYCKGAGNSRYIYYIGTLCRCRERRLLSETGVSYPAKR